MSNEELLALRKQILSDIMPLVHENTNEGTERFSLLLRIIQSGDATNQTYKDAYESAKQIEDTSEKLSSLLSLLDEIDLDMVNVPAEQTKSEEPLRDEQPQE